MCIRDSSNATFREYEFNIDIGDLLDEGDLDSIRSKTSPMMYTLQQIKDTIPKLKNTYDESLALRAKNIYISSQARDLYNYPDSLKNKKLASVTLNNFEVQEKITILNSAVTKTSRILGTIKNNKKSSIYLLKQGYLQQFLNDMREIMTYGLSSEYVNESLIRTENTKVTISN